MFFVVESREKYFLNFSEIFGKIALSGVVGSERKIIVKRVEKLLANVVSHCIPYIGYPRSLNALTALDAAAKNLGL